MTEPAPWTQIYERIKGQIPAAPDALIRNEIYSVMLDLTQDTNIWIEEFPLAIVPNTRTYTVTPTNGQPHRLMVVYNNDPNQNDPASRYRWADSGISMRVPGTIVLYNNPTQNKTWVARIAKAISNYRMVGSPATSTGYPEIDDWIVNMNNDTIYYGTMYFLQRMPSKPFANDKAAKDNYANYMAGKSAARINNMRGNVFDAQNWAYPQSFQTISRKGWA